MARKKSNSPVLTISKPITLDDLTKAAARMANEGGKPDEVIMTTDQYDALHGFFNETYIELKVGDWVFINDNGHLYVGEVIEEDVEDISVEYKVHIKESTEVKKSVFMLLTGKEDIIKVAKGSKLKTLKVLHGR